MDNGEDDLGGKLYTLMDEYTVPGEDSVMDNVKTIMNTFSKEGQQQFYTHWKNVEEELLDVVYEKTGERTKDNIVADIPHLRRFMLEKVSLRTMRTPSLNGDIGIARDLRNYALALMGIREEELMYGPLEEPTKAYK